ncbi:MAG: hypothetical protein ACF8CY_03420, partial [Gimesia chilikensis]
MKIQSAWKNDSGSSVAPFSVLRVTDSELQDGGGLLLICAKPNGEPGTCIVNQNGTVNNGNTGAYFPFNADLFPVKYSGTAPAQGDIIGPVEDSFSATKNGSGFEVLLADPG